MIKRLGIIVDGPGDFAALNSRFRDHFRIVKTDGPRGHAASIEQIVGRSRKQIDILKGFHCEEILLLLDFESRQVPYEKFCDDLRRACTNINFGVPLCVVLPNQMIENWYLADIEQLSKKKRKLLRERVKQKKFEGKHGKNELKRLMNHEVSYNEVKHGPEFFGAIRFSIAKNNSRSFKRFCDVVERY